MPTSTKQLSCVLLWETQCEATILTCSCQQTTEHWYKGCMCRRQVLPATRCFLQYKTKPPLPCFLGFVPPTLKEQYSMLQGTIIQQQCNSHNTTWRDVDKPLLAVVL